MTLVRALEDVARRRPSAPAIAWRDTEWAYDALLDVIRSVRAALCERSLPSGARVALLLRNSPQYVALYYGTLAAGCVAVPLNAHERASVLARQIAHSGAALLVGDADHPEWKTLVASLAAEPVEIVAIGLGEGVDAAGKLLRDLSSPGAPEETASPDDNALAAIIYTSGTTGRPKGVMLSHRNLRSNATAIIRTLDMCPADRGLCVLPLHFSYGNSVLHSHLLSGASLVLEENFAYPQQTLQRMQSARVTGFAGVPSTFAMLLGRHRLADFDLSALRYVTQAGGAMPRPLVEQLRAALPAVRVYLMYGQTEATARLACLPPEDLDSKPGSVGLPIPEVEIEIRDGDRPVAAGVVGEVCARGPNMMLGYWRDENATAEVLRDGWLRTGDLGCMDEDGYVYITGRTVEMIKVGAFRVSPQEVEEVISGLDGVQEAAVVGVPDELLGQSIKAFVVTRPGGELTAMQVKAHCRRYLAAYKVPKSVDFTSALPRTSSGKVQRFKLVREALTHDS